MHFFGQGLEPPGVFYRDLPLRRQTKPLFPPQEQRRPDLLLQQLDMMAHRRLRHGQRLSGPGKILLLHNSQQRLHFASKHAITHS